MRSRRLVLFGLAIMVVLLSAALVRALSLQTFTSIDIVGPSGSGEFGKKVVVLANGNIVVTDPRYDLGATRDVGAVYLYNGVTGALISKLTGSTANDVIGWDGVILLTNGNYVVASSRWDNGAATDAGAVTWGSAITGVSGTVSAANSLVGSTTNDNVGWGEAYGVTPLSNGNYVVDSSVWDNGSAIDAGAVTWGNGATGVKGTINAANSLVGSTIDDRIGYSGVTAFSNGNYVVASPRWDNGSAVDAGAVTWGNGLTGVKGIVSAANSLVGSSSGDSVGLYDLTALNNGNYVVRNPLWANGVMTGAGAVTWVNGTMGIIGPISVTNSLVGSKVYDQVGFYVTALSNGNYVVNSPYWANGAATDAGAATWVDGTKAVIGTVGITNSLVGSTEYDFVGDQIVELTNGNYVVGSPDWNNGVVTNTGAVTWGNGTIGVTGVVTVANSLVGSGEDENVGFFDDISLLSNGNYIVESLAWNDLAGAVTWGNGATGITGVISSVNSLVGQQAGDLVGVQVATLSNGNYVVVSPYWANGVMTNTGAVTWANGTTGITGVVTVTNSLVGSAVNDVIGNFGITALSNGNYIVLSPYWANDNVTKTGAVTWGNGITGITGVVSVSNSLVGASANDQVGVDGIVELSNGNYIVLSHLWDNGAAADAGAATWINSAKNITGTVSPTNSLVGSTASDEVGYFGVAALSNGNYVVRSAHWNNGFAVMTGAVTWGNGATGITGTVNETNSLVGSTANDLVGKYYDVIPTSDGNYIVLSADWDNGGVANTGATTWGDGTTGITGTITSENSVLGAAADGGGGMNYIYSYVPKQLVVGRPADNIVTLFRPVWNSSFIFLPLVIRQ